MAVTYKKLLHLLTDKAMTNTQLMSPDNNPHT